MANADQIKALIKSHLKNDGERFVTVAPQVAATEAKQGHTALARDIRRIIDERPNHQVRVISVSSELDDLVTLENTSGVSTSFVVRKDLQTKLDRIIKEHSQAEKLKKIWFEQSTQNSAFRATGYWKDYDSSGSR